MNYIRGTRKSRRKEKKNKIIIGIIMLACIIISIYLLAILKIPVLSNISSSIVTGIDSVISSIGGTLKNGTSYFGNVNKLKQELELKEQELAKEKQLQVEIDTLIVENNDLKKLLKIEENYNHFTKVYANIITRSYDNWNETFDINKGTKDGIELRQTVISEKGLVGYISAVEENTSTVTTILDPSTSVSVEISNINMLALIKGDFGLMSNSEVKLVNIPIDTELTEGEKIYTSGIGGLYKKGIPIGVIKTVKNKKNEIDRYAIVETFVSLDSLDMVSVIIK